MITSNNPFTPGTSGHDLWEKICAANVAATEAAQ